MAVQPRDISPFLQIFRAFFLGRNHKNALRFQDRLSPRTQPPPNLPDGPSHKLSTNYYYTRDGRREALPPLLVADGAVRKAITAGESKGSDATTVALKTAPVPGSHYVWKKSPDSL